MQKRQRQQWTYTWNFSHEIFKQILVIGDWGISCEIALTWKPQDLTDDKSTLVKVMAWCRQATSHYLSQCWPSSLSPYGVTRPQWVKSLISSPRLTMCSIFVNNIFKSRGPTYPIAWWPWASKTASQVCGFEQNSLLLFGIMSNLK